MHILHLKSTTIVVMSKLAADQLYPSDLTVEQFKVIEPLLRSARKKTAPRREDLREIFNAVLYLLKEGCRWRSLPRDYPDWNLCYYYYSVWRDSIDQESKLPILEVVLKKIGIRASR